MSYIKYYNFYDDPFCDEFKEKYYYESKTVREGLSRLNLLTVKKGLFHLYGEAGMGKTILLKKFSQQLSGEYKITYLNYTKNRSYGLLNILSGQLGLAGRNIKANYEKQLNEYFSSSHQNNIVIIDEAQNLEGEALEEIKLLCSGEYAAGYKFNLILSSGPELRQKLMSNETIRQRLFFFYKLKPLDEDESKEYILFRFRQAGGVENIIADETMGKIFFASKGIMREINKFCTLCLIEAYQQKERMISLRIVERVLQELKNYQNDEVISI